LLKGDNDFKWEDKEQKSFDILKNALCQEPILQYSDFTFPLNNRRIWNRNWRNFKSRINRQGSTDKLCLTSIK